MDLAAVLTPGKAGFNDHPVEINFTLFLRIWETNWIIQIQIQRFTLNSNWLCLRKFFFRYSFFSWKKPQAFQFR